jgi:hypothetical protein
MAAANALLLSRAPHHRSSTRYAAVSSSPLFAVPPRSFGALMRCDVMGVGCRVWWVVVWRWEWVHRWRPASSSRSGRAQRIWQRWPQVRCTVHIPCPPLTHERWCSGLSKPKPRYCSQHTHLSASSCLLLLTYTCVCHRHFACRFRTSILSMRAWGCCLHLCSRFCRLTSSTRYSRLQRLCTHNHQNL